MFSCDKAALDQLNREISFAWGLRVRRAFGTSERLRPSVGEIWLRSEWRCSGGLIGKRRFWASMSLHADGSARYGRIATICATPSYSKKN